MALIPLTQGQVAIIDDCDYPLVAGMKWYAKYERGNWYAAHNYGRKSGYKIVKLHRYLLDTPPGVDVDHDNHNGLDCRRANIRNCNKSQNQANSLLKATNKSGFKGVSKWRVTTWRTTIRVNGKSIHIGVYQDIIEAARAYDLAAVTYFGAFALTNAAMGLLPLLRSEQAGVA